MSDYINIKGFGKYDGEYQVKNHTERTGELTLTKCVDVSTLKGKVVYVAGKINGLPTYRSVFGKAEKELIDAGAIVLNPASLPEGLPYEAYLPICFAMLDSCDYIYMLPNWIDSKGAKAEHEYALAQSKTIIYLYK